MHQHVLTEWNLPGTAESSRTTTASHAQPDTTPQPCTTTSSNETHVIPFSDPSRLLRTGALPTSVSMDDDGTIADDEMQQELGQGEGEDYDECEDEPTDAANQQSHSTLPPPVQQWYEEHLSMLKAFKKTSTPQNYYDLHGTFWLPCQSSYFVIHSKTTPRPANVYNPHFFYWDPDLLVVDGLRCPLCSSQLKRDRKSVV